MRTFTKAPALVALFLAARMLLPVAPTAAAAAAPRQLAEGETRLRTRCLTVSSSIDEYDFAAQRPLISRVRISRCCTRTRNDEGASKNCWASLNWQRSIDGQYSYLDQSLDPSSIQSRADGSHVLPRPDGGEFVATPDSAVPEMSCTSEENAEGRAGSYRRCGEDAVLLAASTTFDHDVPGSEHAARESIVLSNQYVTDRNGPFFLRCGCGFPGLDSIGYYDSDSDSEGLGGRTAGSAAGVGDPFSAQSRHPAGKVGGASDRGHSR